MKRAYMTKMGSSGGMKLRGFMWINGGKNVEHMTCSGYIPNTLHSGLWLLAWEWVYYQYVIIAILGTQKTLNDIEVTFIFQK